MKNVIYAQFVVSIHGLKTEISHLESLGEWIKQHIHAKLTAPYELLYNFRDEFASDIHVELDETATIQPNLPVNL